MVYIILGSGFEEIEAVTSYDVLNRGGVPVCFAGLDDLLCIGAHGIKIQAENTFANAVPEIDDHILIPGGMGGVNSIKADRNAMEKIKTSAQKGTKLAAICAGPAVLAELGLLDGKAITCYPGCEELMAKARCNASDPTAVDGDLVTGRSPGAAMEFALELLGKITNEETANRVRRAMVI